MENPQDTPRSVPLKVLKTKTKRKPTSTRGKWRAGVLIAVHLIIATRIVHWKLTGSTVSPVEPSESMETLELGTLNAGFVFFIAAIVSTLLLGRFFCGWGCHVVALQDLCGWCMKKVGVRPHPFRSRLMIFFPLALALYMFVWPTFKRIALIPLLENVWPAALSYLKPVPSFPAQGFTNEFIVEDFWATFPGIAIAIPFLFLCGFAAVYFLGAKGFCTYGCPYGGFFGVADRFAVGRIKVDDEKCDSNGHCTAVCTSNVSVHTEIKEYGMVVNPGCMKCLDCISACPTNALSFGFAKPEIIKGEPKRKPKAPVFDLSLGEDIVFAVILVASFLAARSLYGVVPLLMAAGIAGIVTFVLWKGYRTLTVNNVRFHKLQLRRQGKFTAGGIGWIAASVVVGALLVHSLAVNLTKWSGERSLRLTGLSSVPFESLMGITLDGDRTAEAEKALRAFERTDSIARGGIGLVTEPAMLSTVARLKLALGDTDGAFAALDRLESTNGLSDHIAVSKGRLMFRLSQQALADIARDPTDERIREGQELARGYITRMSEYWNAVLEEHPEFWEVRDALVQFQLDGWTRIAQRNPEVAAQRINILEAAEALCRDAIEEFPSDSPEDRLVRGHAFHSLAGVLHTKGIATGEFGMLSESLELRRQAVELQPNDPFLRERYAVALFENRDLDGAIAQMVVAVRRGGTAQRYLALGRLYAARGSFDSAQRALTIAVGNAGAQELLIARQAFDILNGAGQADRAAELLKDSEIELSDLPATNAPPPAASQGQPVEGPPPPAEGPSPLTP